MVVRELADWLVSASALFDRLNDQITREQLVEIVSLDPFGAHQHFPILARIRSSGQVPAKLDFDPGEALRLMRWGSGPDVDHLARAWCCTLLVIAPDSSDELYEVAAQLAESCLALGGDVPQLAEQLLAWRAVTETPCIARRRGEDHDYPDPVALLTPFLLCVATDLTDARLVGLAQTLVDAFAAPEVVFTTGRRLPRDLRRVLTPLRPVHPDLDRLVDALS